MNSRFCWIIVTTLLICLIGCQDINMTHTNKQIRFEHIAFNVSDPVAVSQWYVGNLGMKIIRQGPPPVNMRFISDTGENMMFEFYHNDTVPVPDYQTIQPLQVHIAFMTDDITATRDRLTQAGAQPQGEIETTPAGDQILMMRDPWNLPIQFVTRAQPMMHFP